MILSELGFGLSLQEQRATSSSLRPLTHPGRNKKSVAAGLPVPCEFCSLLKTCCYSRE